MQRLIPLFSISNEAKSGGRVALGLNIAGVANIRICTCALSMTTGTVCRIIFAERIPTGTLPANWVVRSYLTSYNDEVRYGGHSMFFIPDSA